jgi:uncharacterized protein (TIGR00106 family)
MPIMEISVIPLGTKTPSLSKYIASCIEVIRKEKGIKFELTAMGTIVEAVTLKRLLNIAVKMHKAVMRKGAKRIVTTIKIDERLDKRLTIQGKINSVKQKLS